MDRRLRVSWNVLVGERVRARRERDRLRQEELAGLMRRFGTAWQRDTVAAVERGHRRLSVQELVTLAGVFDMPVGELLALDAGEDLVIDGQGWRADQVVVELDEDGSPPSFWGYDSVIATMLGGDQPYVWAAGSAPWNPDPTTEADRKAAVTLGIEVEELNRRSVSAWGRILSEERDARLGIVGTDPTTARTVQARRGHMTRRLLEEVRSRMSTEVLDALAAEQQPDTEEEHS